MISSTLYSSANEVWSTPQDFFAKLDEEFHFTLDPCALPENAKCDKFYTPDDDGLAQDWGGRKCSAIRQTVAISFSGARSVTKKAESRILSWCCWYIQGQTHDGFMSGSMVRQSCVSSEVD